MDTTAQDIVFDDMGFCNYCNEFLKRSSHVILQHSEERTRELGELVNRIKRNGQGKPYDCIVGVSGGVDSSWALVKAVELGLRPLAVHMDNGWNSELAQNNIANLIRSLGVDLYTYVIEWNEYRSLMQALLDADVIDIEILYDNAMVAVNYQQATKYRLKYILGGTNQATEGMLIPDNWSWYKFDAKNIKYLGMRFSKTKLKTFPAYGTLSYIWYTQFKRIKWASILDYYDYNKKKAMEDLQKNYAYKPYPYKHYESVFTRYYQGYILTEKFGIDKRKLHLSTLIISGQLTRKEALEVLQEIPYPNMKELEQDKHYFLKKMGWTEEQLSAYLRRPEIRHDHYKSEKYLWDLCCKVYSVVKR